MTPIFSNIRNELMTATNKHGKFHSDHEGIAIIREEFEELWDTIKDKQNTRGKREAAMFEECIQLSAMTVRFIIDNCSKIIKENVKVKKIKVNYKDLGKLINNGK